jgi:hypothetical protein
MSEVSILLAAGAELPPVLAVIVVPEAALQLPPPPDPNVRADLP